MRREKIIKLQSIADFWKSYIDGTRNFSASPPYVFVKALINELIEVQEFDKEIAIKAVGSMNLEISEFDLGVPACKNLIETLAAILELIISDISRDFPDDAEQVFLIYCRGIEVKI